MTDESNPISRRTFVRDGATAAAAFAMAPMIVPRHVLGGVGYRAPSRTLNVAMIGFGGMGMTNMNALLQAGENIVAVCDIDYSVRRALHRRPGPAAAGADRRAARRRQAAGGLHQGEEVRRLPHDVRQAEGHRRRRHRHAGPSARDRRVRRDEARQARVRAEAAHLHRAGGAAARAHGARHEGRHADGEPGALDGGHAAHQRADRRRRARPDPRGPHVDRPARALLGAGDSASRHADPDADDAPRSERAAAVEHAHGGQRGAQGDGRRSADGAAWRELGSLPRADDAPDPLSPGLSTRSAGAASSTSA